MKLRVGKQQGNEDRSTGRRPTLPLQPATAADPWALPERMGPYRLGAVLGQGGMGRVYAAHDEVLDREVALKLLWRSDPTLLLRFLQEAQFQARLDHPNICKIYEVETTGPAPFIAMERIHGRSLLETELDLDLAELLELMIQSAEAVQAAHEAGMIHRDLKPDNILLRADGAGGWQPVLLDFGLAKELDGPGLTVGSRVMGTPAYMAPEQALGQGVSARSDVYSLGATFYAFLAGQSPFLAHSAGELLLKQSRDEPAPLRSLNPAVPPALALILATCMRKEPALRYGTAAALAQDLRRLKAGLPILARRPGVRRAWLAAAAALVLLGGAAGAGWRRFRPQPPGIAQRSPEQRRAMAQVIKLVSEQHNSESDRTAMEMLRKVIAEDPLDPESHQILASILTSLASEAAHHGRREEIRERLAEARKESETTIRLAPARVGGYYTLATTQRLEGDLDGAEHSVQLALKLRPQEATGYWMLSSLASQRPGPEAFQAAIGHARTGVRLSPSEPVAHYRLAQIHLDGGQFPQALAAVEQALALNPSMEYAHLVRSNILIWSGRTAEAERELKAALARVPNARLLKRNLVYTAFLARDSSTFPARLAISRELWPSGHPTRVFLEGLEDGFQGRWPMVRKHYGAVLASLRASQATLTATESSSASVDLYLMGRVLAQSPERTVAVPFIEFADTLYPRRLRLARRDPAFHGLWPPLQPWPGDE